MEIDTVIGDTAYFEKNNIQYANEHKLQLVAKLSPIVTHGPCKKEEEFEFNTDAGMYVCKAGCYKEGAKSKTCSVTIKSTEHKEQQAFQESPYFKEKGKERYKIEVKNSELKHRHGYDVASSLGLVGMQMQGAMAIFTVNLK